MSHYDKNLDKNNANFVPLTPLSFLKRAKDIYPNYEALVYEDRKYTWSEVYKRCTKFASALEKTSFLIGLGPFASAKSAKWMNDNLFGVDVPDQIIKRLEQAKDQKEESKKICLELIQIFREIKGVKGIHLMGHKKEEVIAEIIKESKIS